MAKKGQKYREFTREEKIKAVKRVLVKGEAQMQVEREVLGVTKSTGTLNRWIREYIQEGEENAFKKKRGIKKIKNESELRYQILKKFNAFLDKEIKTNSNSSNNSNQGSQ